MSPLLLLPLVFVVLCPVVWLLDRLWLAQARREVERRRMFLPATWTGQARMYRDAGRHLRGIR